MHCYGIQFEKEKYKKLQSVPIILNFLYSLDLYLYIDRNKHDDFESHWLCYSEKWTINLPFPHNIKKPKHLLAKNEKKKKSISIVAV